MTQKDNCVHQQLVSKSVVATYMQEMKKTGKEYEPFVQLQKSGTERVCACVARRMRTKHRKETWRRRGQFFVFSFVIKCEKHALDR